MAAFAQHAFENQWLKPKTVKVNPWCLMESVPDIRDIITTFTGSVNDRQQLLTKSVMASTPLY